MGKAVKTPIDKQSPTDKLAEAGMNWMNKEDRKLLKELNQRIAHNPRLFAQRLAMQAKFLQKQRLLQAGLAGFIFGVFLTATGFCALNLTAAEKETTSSRTPVSESAPKLTPASERDS